MSDRERELEGSDHRADSARNWFAGWGSQEEATLEATLSATPAQRLEWLEEAIEIAWASGALPRE